MEIEQSAGKQFWDDQMLKHPRIRGIFNIIGDIIGFFLQGHFIVALGHWVVMTAGRIAETAMLFATLWITATNVAPQLTNKLGTLSGTLSDLSLITFSLLPEVILFAAIVTTYRHWAKAVRLRRDPESWTWSALYSLPTTTFFVMTVLTICSFVNDGGHIQHATGVMLVIRCLAGWFYSLVELIHSMIVKPQKVEPTAALEPVPAPVQEIDYLALAQAIAPLLEPQFRTMIPAPAPAPEPLNYQEIAKNLAPLMVPEPAPEPYIDYHAIAREVAPLMKPTFVEARRTIIEEVKAIVPQLVPAPMPVAPGIPTRATAKSQKHEGERAETERDERLEVAFQELLKEGKGVSGRKLAERAKCNRKAANEWLKVAHPEHAGSTDRSQSQMEPAPEQWIQDDEADPLPGAGTTCADPPMASIEVIELVPVPGSTQE